MTISRPHDYFEQIRSGVRRCGRCHIPHTLGLRLHHATGENSHGRRWSAYWWKDKITALRGRCPSQIHYSKSEDKELGRACGPIGKLQELEEEAEKSYIQK